MFLATSRSKKPTARTSLSTCARRFWNIGPTTTSNFCSAVIRPRLATTIRFFAAPPGCKPPPTVLSSWNMPAMAACCPRRRSECHWPVLYLPAASIFTTSPNTAPATLCARILTAVACSTTKTMGTTFCSARPSRLSGLQAGGSWFHDKISDNSAGTIGSRYGQTLVNAYLVYNGHGFELLNEGFLLRHAELHGPELFNMPAFYVQASRRFGHFRPFVRYQYVNANPESVFNDVLLRYGPSLGARYDFNTFVACKAQLDRTVRKNEPDLNGLHLQVAFTF